MTKLPCLSFPFLAFFVLCVGVLAPSHAESQNKTPSMRMTENATAAGWQLITSGDLYIVADIADFGGYLGVCGSWTRTGEITSHDKRARVVHKLLTRGSVFLGNKRLVRNLSFMREVPQEAFGYGLEIPCAITDIRWQDSFSGKELKIRSPRITVIY